MVEDDQEAMDSTAMLLRGQGHEILEARDGPNAVSCILSRKPQLVILDLGLASPDPQRCLEFDGYTVLAWINRMEASKRIPIVVLTSTAASIGKNRALELGACAYLEKPVEAQKLLTTIQIALDEI